MTDVVAPDHQSDDGHSVGEPLDRLDESAPIVDALDVEGDRPGKAI